jgi:hypothetical protein
VFSLSSSVEQLPTRSPLPTGKRNIDALLAESVLLGPGEIRYFFPDAPLLASASDLQGLGPLWALNTNRQREFRLALGEWTAVAAVRPRQVASLDQASLAVVGVSKGNSSVRTFNGSPVLMQFILDEGPLLDGRAGSSGRAHHPSAIRHPGDSVPLRG